MRWWDDQFLIGGNKMLDFCKKDNWSRRTALDLIRVHKVHAEQCERIHLMKKDVGDEMTTELEQEFKALEQANDDVLQQAKEIMIKLAADPNAVPIFDYVNKVLRNRKSRAKSTFQQKQLAGEWVKSFTFKDILCADDVFTRYKSEVQNPVRYLELVEIMKNRFNFKLLYNVYFDSKKTNLLIFFIDEHVEHQCSVYSNQHLSDLAKANYARNTQ